MRCTSKNTFLLFFLTLSIYVNAFGQETAQPKKTNLSISAGYGYNSIAAIGQREQIFRSKFLDYNSGLYYSKSNSSGAFVLGIKISSKRWKYGLDIAYETFSKEVVDAHFEVPKYLGNSKVSFWGVVPRVDYYWLNKRIIRAYSGIGIGVGNQFEKYDFVDLSSDWTRLMVNIVPLGFEVGNTFSVFGESSLGMNGLVCGGVRVRL